jgi:hypothetical protein
MAFSDMRPSTAVPFVDRTAGADQRPARSTAASASCVCSRTHVIAAVPDAAEAT